MKEYCPFCGSKLECKKVPLGGRNNYYSYECPCCGYSHGSTIKKENTVKSDD